jgi:hypothetical protein
MSAEAAHLPWRNFPNKFWGLTSLYISLARISFRLLPLEAFELASVTNLQGVLMKPHSGQSSRG